MVARLKLKEIDGRAPPGVNLVRLSKQLTLRLKAARKGDVVSPDSHNASPSCTDLRILRRRAVFDTAPPGGGTSRLRGHTSKLREHPVTAYYQAGIRKVPVATLIASGMVTT